ncbi:M23 family metallopeptidase [soil metagenome]
MLTRVLLFLAMTTPAAALELSLPIDCRFGETCFIQQYADHDPGKGTRDYACGAETYDGHDGIDIRLRSFADIEAGVPVIAAAPGVVRAMRDGETDRLARTAIETAAVKERECGNGVVIDHEAGYQTQYCHMRLASIAVKPGDRVTAGQKLGEVGASGMAAFPHVHMTLRENGKAIDPFQPDASAQCGAMSDRFWSAAARQALTYRAGDIITLGFADGPVELDALEKELPAPGLSPQSSALVAYAWAINLQKDDRISIALKAPDGSVLAENAVALDHSKAQYMLFSGKKKPPSGWPPGTYTAAVSVVRGGTAVIERTQTLTIK